MKQGWIKLHRKIQDCNIWTDTEEPFDRRSAWIDLLLTANHSDKIIIFDGQKMTISRGQILTSVRKLSAKWNRSTKWTLRFLRLLEELEMLEKKSDSKKTLLTIVNYSVYQGGGNTEEHTKEYTEAHTEEYTEAHAEEHTKEYTEAPQTRSKEYKNEEELLKNDKELKNDNNMSARADTPTAEDVREVIKLYNLYCVSMPECQKLTDKRTKAIKTRLKKYSLDDFEKVFKLAEQSDFLTGRNGKWTNCNIDWLINENNMIKVLEGNYRNHDKDNLQSAYDTIDEWVNQMEAQNGV